MSENLFSICAVGCIVIMYFIKPEEPYFSIAINPNGNILNKVTVKINESYTNKISEIISKISFWSSNNNMGTEEIKLAKQQHKQNEKISKKKIPQKQYFYRYTKFKPFEYITDDGDYGQFVIIDA
jgi:hypothetical protein